jgi:hypothetical protein
MIENQHNLSTNQSWRVSRECIRVLDKTILLIAAVILTITGLLKVLSTFSSVPYLANPDPVLTFMSNKSVLLIAGNLELVIALLIFLRPQGLHARQALLALCATLVMYRIGLWILPVSRTCPCLGRATDWLHLTPTQAESISRTLLLILALIAACSIGLHRKALGVTAPIER